MNHELDEIGGHHHSGIHKSILLKIRHLYSHHRDNWQRNLGCTFVVYFQILEELCQRSLNRLNRVEHTQDSKMGILGFSAAGGEPTIGYGGEYASMFDDGHMQEHIRI
jgi:hypothetical protein